MNFLMFNLSVLHNETSLAIASVNDLNEVNRAWRNAYDKALHDRDVRDTWFIIIIIIVFCLAIGMKVLRLSKIYDINLRRRQL